MPIYQDLEFRGLIKQMTDPELPKLLNEKKLTVYAGFDPSADSLHIGHLLPLLNLRRLQLAGHRPIAVVGGATGRIGDPSGKSSERTLLSEEVIENNLKGIEKVIRRFLDFEGPNAAKVVNNYEWLKGFSFLGFLRDVGKYFSVNSMIAKESVRARLEDRDQGISYTEFSYMLIQAYDFYHLYENESCALQIGGSDQWGNITAGCELIRRMAAAHGKPAAQAYGLTFPLVMKSDGTKFGKTESGALWLTADKTSPYQFYQYFVRVADADVILLLRYFTFLSQEEIKELESSIQSEPEKRRAQTRLAEELTKLVHGEEGLKQARHASEAFFSGNFMSLDEKTLLELFSEAPSTQKPKDSLNGDLSIIDLLVETGLAPSKSRARQEVQAGAITVNQDKITDLAAKVNPSELVAGKFLILRKGKKTYHLVSFS